MSDTSQAPIVTSVQTMPRFRMDKDALYIGRWHHSPRYGTIQASVWGNPYVPSHGISVDECLAAYEAHIRRKPNLMKLIPTLTGKALMCWCKTEKRPDAPCHGDVLVKLWKEWYEAQNA